MPTVPTPTPTVPTTTVPSDLLINHRNLAATAAKQAAGLADGDDDDAAADGFSGGGDKKNTSSLTGATRRSAMATSYLSLTSSSSNEGVLALARSFGMSADQFGQNIDAYMHKFSTVDPALAPATMAQQNISHRHPASADVLKAARRILALEIAAQPSIRQNLRDLFQAYGVLSTERTEKGEKLIDSHHALYGVRGIYRKTVDRFNRHYLNFHRYAEKNGHCSMPDGSLLMHKAGENADGTPIMELAENFARPHDADDPADLIPLEAESHDCTQILLIHKGVQDGLLRCRVRFQAEADDDPNKITQPKVFSMIRDLYLSEGTSSVARAWNEQRELVLREAMDDYLYPQVCVQYCLPSTVCPLNLKTIFTFLSWRPRPSTASSQRRRRGLTFSRPAASTASCTQPLTGVRWPWTHSKARPRTHVSCRASFPTTPRCLAPSA